MELTCAACGAENPLAAERYDVHVRTYDFALQAGAVVQVIPGWWFGLGYVMPPTPRNEIPVTNFALLRGLAAICTGPTPVRM